MILADGSPALLDWGLAADPAAVEEGHAEGRPVAADVGGRARVQERARDALPAVRRGREQRALVVVVARVGVGAGGEQELHGGELAVVGRDVQRRRLERLAKIHVDALPDEVSQALDVAAHGCGLQRDVRRRLVLVHKLGGCHPLAKSLVVRGLPKI